MIFDNDINIEDIQLLNKLEDKIEVLTDEVCKLWTEEAKLKIVLIDHLKEFPEISSSASLDNKILEMKRRAHDLDVFDNSDAWIINQTHIKQKERWLKTVEGRRDSLKKEIQIKPQ